MNVSEYIKKLLSYEEYSFSTDELYKKIDKNKIAIKSELSRLIEKQEVINVRKGFYIILTPRYSNFKKLPIQLYCDKLFNYLSRDYYLAFYTAAKLHGAGHQQIQQDYVMTGIPKLNDIHRNSIDIIFLTSSRWPKDNIINKKSDAGIYKISSPALTIADLIQYQNSLGGINRMLAIIEELAESMEEQDVVKLMNNYSQKSTLQRFGFLLDEIGGYEQFSEFIYEKLLTGGFYPVLLNPKSDEKPGAVNNRWKVDVNIKLDSDL